MRATRILQATCVAAASTLAFAGCTGGGGAAGDGPVTIEFSGWAPGYAEAVAAFNASHPDIQVTYTEISPGTKGGYDTLMNGVTAGTGTCLAQVGYESLTSFVAKDALLDVSEYANASADKFTPGSWASVSLDGAVYGAPVDIGPVALFYRTDVFEAAGVEVPTTWDEYAALGPKLRAANPNTYLTSDYLDYNYAGLAQQAGAPWFGIDGDSWTVSIDSAANTKVADYWQGLVDQGFISPATTWDPAWNQGLADGSIATYVGPAWMTGILKGDSADGAGKWAVAPAPQWKAGESVGANVGGSSTAVLKTCANPEAAWTFAEWMSTDEATFGALVDAAGLYPAAVDLADLPALTQPDDYFGGQVTGDVFAAEAATVPDTWVWGPNMPATITALNDGLSGAWHGTGTISGALGGAQEKTVATLTGDGLSVK